MDIEEPTPPTREPEPGFKTSSTIAELITALSSARGEMDKLTKNKTNPFHRSNYADLGQVIEVAVPHLSDNGLVMIQGTAPMEGGWLKIVSRLCHKSGEWIESSLTLSTVVTDKNGTHDNPQTRGIALTYGRRYLYTAMIGLAQQDSDAQENVSTHPQKKKPVIHNVGKPPAKKVAPAKKAAKAPEPATLGSQKALNEAIKAVPLSPERVKDGCMLVSKQRTDDPSELLEGEVLEMIEMINKKLKKNEK